MYLHCAEREHSPFYKSGLAPGGIKPFLGAFPGSKKKIIRLQTATMIPKFWPSLQQTHAFPGYRSYQAAVRTGHASGQMAGGPVAATESRRLLFSVKNFCPQRNERNTFLPRGCNNEASD